MKLDNLFHDFKAALIYPVGIKDKESLQTACQAGKVLVVAAAVAALAAAILTAPVGLIFGAIGGIILYETFMALHNIEKTAKDPNWFTVKGIGEVLVSESTSGWSEAQIKIASDRIGDRTLLVKPLLSFALKCAYKD